MFNIGPLEWLVILIVVIIFVKPEDLPKLIRQIGKIYGNVTRTINEINAMVADLDTEIKRPLIQANPLSVSRSISEPKKDDPVSSEPLKS